MRLIYFQLHLESNFFIKFYDQNAWKIRYLNNMKLNIQIISQVIKYSLSYKFVWRVLIMCKKLLYEN